MLLRTVKAYSRMQMAKSRVVTISTLEYPTFLRNSNQGHRQPRKSSSCELTLALSSAQHRVTAMEVPMRDRQEDCFHMIEVLN